MKMISWDQCELTLTDKSLYKVLTPSIKRPYKFLWAYGSSWHHMVSLGTKELTYPGSYTMEIKPAAY